jgi:serine/threonine protein kinase
MPPFKEGDVINNRYIVEKLIGKGESSYVYKVYDKQSNRYYALKLLMDKWLEEPPIANRFRTEANLLSELSHENIIRTYDINIGANLNYYTMEYSDNAINLSTFIRLQPKPSATLTINILKQILKGIMFLHSKQIIHRDIKPSNILLNINGSGENNFTVKLADFGLVKKLDKFTTASFSTFCGTFAYMSPEQIKGKECVYSSDIYSIGETIYELISGTPRCNADSLETLALTKSKEPNFRIKDFYTSDENNNDLTKEEIRNRSILVEWLNIALQPKIEKRFKNCQEALYFIQKNSIRRKYKLKTSLTKLKTIMFLLSTVIFIAIIIAFSFYSYYKNKLSEIKVFSTHIEATNRFGHKIWDARYPSFITSAEIVNDLTSKIKKAVIVSLDVGKTEKDAAHGGQINLIGEDGNIIWERRLGGEEWIKGTGSYYSFNIKGTYDIDNDGEKEILVLATNEPYFPAFLITLEPEDGSSYGIVWNYGTGFGPINVIEKDSKKYIIFNVLNNIFETKIVAWINISGKFNIYMPGWPEIYVSDLNTASIKLGITPWLNKSYDLTLTLQELVKPEETPFEIAKKKIAKDNEIIEIKGNKKVYRFDFDGYPVDENGRRIYKENKNALSPTEFLLKLNSYGDLLKKKEYKEAISLCQNLIPYTPNIPDFQALIYMLLGKTQLKAGNIMEAITSLRKSIEIKRTRNRAYFYLAEALIINNKLD